MEKLTEESVIVEVVINLAQEARCRRGVERVTPTPLPSTFQQRHYTENSKQIFPEMKLRRLVPNLCFCELFLYSDNLSSYFAAEIGEPIAWEYINFSLIRECGSWDRGRAVSYLGIHKSDLLGSVFAVFHDDIYFGPLLC
jgi:hypothetical protein